MRMKIDTKETEKKSFKNKQRTMFAAVYHKFGGKICVESIPRPFLCCATTGTDGDRHGNAKHDGAGAGADDDDDHAIIIQVKATGVCRSDWHGWKGHDNDIQQHGLPFVPGHEVSGVVVQVGNQCNELFTLGDRVVVPFILSCGRCRYCCMLPVSRPTICLQQKQPGFTQYGSFAEYMKVPRADRNVAKLPDNVSYSQAAALGCRFTTAYRAVLQQGRLAKKESVAIFGCGGLGLSCIMMAVAQGAQTIIAVDVSERALTKAKELGATHTVRIIDDNADNNNARERIVVITDGGADLCIEASGFPTACENAVWCTRPAGRMVQVGLVVSHASHQHPPQPLDVPMAMVTAKEIEIIGSHGFAAVDLPHLLQMVSTGQLDPSRLIERYVSLEEGAQAIQDMDYKSPLGITMITTFPNSRSRL